MSDRKIYRPVEFLNEVKVQELATKPAWTASDRRRIIRVVADNNFYFGGNAGWEEISKPDHNHDGDFALTGHTHTTIPNNLTITGDLVATGYMKSSGFAVGAAEVIDNVGYIDFTRIKNHPTYCDVNCQCDCTTNCDCDCRCCEA